MLKKESPNEEYLMTTDLHHFHIPVMGIGFTIDTPIKVAPFGISSVISLVDDMLMEKLREKFSQEYDLPFSKISNSDIDHRAKRITAYLNLVHDVAESRFFKIINEPIHQSIEAQRFIRLLPPESSTKKDLLNQYGNIENCPKTIKELSPEIQMGSIDVNIMTKLDKENYQSKEQLPAEYNDAHAALRGFAHSKLNSAMVFSAGMNPKLFSYLESFSDFYPNENGEFHKKIILKVSDYRSALIQGKYLAKKGLWVSEFRIESGLNCGGHAFASDGLLMGPILNEFNEKWPEMEATLYEQLQKTLKSKNAILPAKPLKIKLTAQGGIGHALEHQFLRNQYHVESVGWGTPFLLVPEVTNVDEDTLEKLCAAKEDDIELSHISPLGVPFNNLKSNTKDEEKRKYILEGNPGSLCPKKYASNNVEFSSNTICTASRQYQSLKIKELKEMNYATDAYETAFDKITAKSCICVGLGTAALIKNNINTKIEGPGVSICPGPNIAYYSKVMTLEEMIDLIYQKNHPVNPQRPHFIIKEIQLYIDFITNKTNESLASENKKELKGHGSFIDKLMEGIAYYQINLSSIASALNCAAEQLNQSLEESKRVLQKLNQKLEQFQKVAS